MKYIILALFVAYLIGHLIGYVCGYTDGEDHERNKGHTE